jgi:3-oxoacyl-[acyl-carrier protein] reductase
MIRAYLAFGSNLGDRQKYLDDALRRLRAEPGLTISKVSPYYETAPVGGPSGQNAYLNGVAEAKTHLSPEQLLHTLLSIEKELGRVRSEPNAPRTIDLDLILYGDLVRSEPDPILPHPRMAERRFVLEPLADLAPNLVHPVFRKSVRELLAGLEDEAPQVHLRQELPSSRELAGRRALITGSTTGIGQAIALELARAGADVIIHGRSQQKAAEATAKQVRELGVQTQIILADLTHPEEVDRLVQEAWGCWSGIDIFVQNAGVDLLTGDSKTWSFEEKWASLVAVDLTASLRLCRAFGERMAHGGSILTMGWDQAEVGMEGDSGQLFGTAKAGVMAFTRSLAKTLAPRVRVNCLAPGWIKTEWGETASIDWQERVRKETPLGRWGLPEDVAQTARWLCSPAAAFISGQIVRINGGAV